MAHPDRVRQHYPDGVPAFPVVKDAETGIAIRFIKSWRPSCEMEGRHHDYTLLKDEGMYECSQCGDRWPFWVSHQL